MQFTCYLVVHELGITATALAKNQGMTQPTVGISVKRGEMIIREREIQIVEIFKL